MEVLPSSLLNIVPSFVLSNSGNYTLRIDLSDFMDEQRFAQYEKFRVADEQVVEVASLKLGILNTQRKKISISQMLCHSEFWVCASVCVRESFSMID